LAAESPPATAGEVISADGTKLAFRAWPKDRADLAFAVVHGFGEHSGRYERFAAGMAAHGMSTYAVDLRGHGNSPGQRGYIDSWSQWTDDASAFVKHVEAIAGTEVIPLGHSFGGATVLSTVLAGKLPTSKRFIISSPALRVKVAVPGWKITLGNAASKLVPRFALDAPAHGALLSRIPEVIHGYDHDPLVHSKMSSRLYTEWQQATSDIAARAAQIKIPFLIVAGSGDNLIDPDGSRELHARSPSTSELKIFEGRLHEPFNDLGSEEVFQVIADWLRKK
jgi:alpha-beta hydrolase superfamily lysophospholipase